MWSVAEHGPTQILVDRLRPLLIKYKVAAYLSGHDHDMQHLREKNHSVEYFVIGAGHDTNPSMAHMVSEVVCVCVRACVKDLTCVFLHTE